MKGVLPDVNVLLAILHAEHEHASVAQAWLETQTDPAVIRICRVTHMGVLRLLTRRSVMGERLLSPEEAWSALETLLSDDRFVFVAEPLNLAEHWKSLSLTMSRGSSIDTDTYLASLALSLNLEFVTFDKGFSRFPGLDLNVLRPGVSS